MSLPEMLRHRDVAMRNMNSFTYGPNFGAELAVLVEADSELVDAVVALAHGEHCDCDICGAVRNVTAARAALVAKIGGTE